MASPAGVPSARFSALDGDVNVGDWDLSEPGVRPRSARREAGAVFTVPPDAPLFADATRSSSSRRWVSVLAVAALVMAVGGGAYAMISTGDGLAAVRSFVSGDGASDHPLELLSLHHTVEPDGSFQVTGLVQNPLGGSAAQHVVAVMYLFDRDGNFFASGRAPLEFGNLQPGEESPFVIKVPDVTGVARYRVGFRTDDGQVVAHVDRRGQPVAGTTAGS